MEKTAAKTILIIEDEFPMRYLIEYQLKQNGYEVNLAKDGRDGLNAIERQKPDLVLLDVMMPGMDGFEVCAEIKNNPETADIPVIFVTASEVHEYRLKAFDVGAADYLTKPFRPHELMAQITAVLHRQEVIDENEQTTGQKMSSQIISLFSPKGGVGVTTLAVQLAEALPLYAERSVALIDMALPFGGIAQALHLFPRHDIVELISVPQNYITLSIIDQFGQRYRDNCLVIPAPGRFINPETELNLDTFNAVTNLLKKEGFDVLIDLGSQLTRFNITLMAQSDHVIVVTSGQPQTNELVDNFLKTSDQFGVEPRQLLPVINEIHGSVREVSLSRVPVARIPYTGEPSDTRLWLREQGMRKLVGILH